MSSPLDHNKQAWDRRSLQGNAHTRTATEKDLKNPLPVLDPGGWMGGDVTGKTVLCLASGGGLQGPLFAAAGARVTVVDLSPRMLDQDVAIARKRHLKIRTLEASMDSLPMLTDAEFDLVVQPVSTCYVPDVGAVYREVARVIRPGGLYISQHKQPGNLQAGAQPRESQYPITEPYYRTGALPPIMDGFEHREADSVEFLHRWEELIGAMCRAGFVIEDLVEPRHGRPEAPPGSFPHRSHFIPPYVKIKARRTHPTPSSLILQRGQT